LTDEENIQLDHLSVYMKKSVEESFLALKRYCESENYRGWDPYDGLNSRIFRATPLNRWRLARLAWIQLFKRSPINLRKLLLVPREYNAKGIGLFLSGYVNLYRMSIKSVKGEKSESQKYLEKINHLTELLADLRSGGYSGDCWGYNFDWQAKAFYQPKNTPTVVATSFIGNALLDAYEITMDESLLNSARSACDFILKDLYRTYDTDGNFSFSYSPLDKTVVFNASLLGSRLLSRVYSYTRDKELAEEAKKSVIFSCKHQKDDGSWPYGTLPFHQWIDNFHTGYNLECIAGYTKNTGDSGFEETIRRGFEYYIHTFFTEEGIPKYYNNRIYPVDIHAPAQLIITLSRLERLDTYRDLSDRVLDWCIDKMQSDKGYFYYQVNSRYSSKIPYMRWAQAWMFYALSEYLLKTK